MSNGPRFINKAEVCFIHHLQILWFGGASGMRDEGMLDSALGRAVNRWEYETPTITRLAADYAFGIARNHPFVDGNKRTALVASYTFLRLNGLRLVASESDATSIFLALASGEIDDLELTSWFDLNVK